MKIGKFAEKNNVTAKMLRYYDEIGLLKPSETDGATGYRSYDEEQSKYLNWILILKNLDFSLAQIKEMLGGPVDGGAMIRMLISKRIEISNAFNEQVQKKIAIDRLIKIVEKEGFQMDKQIDLMGISQESIHEIKKNMPNMEMFLEEALNILALNGEADEISVFRFDICHFKQVNDEYGYEVGDGVIVACYSIIKANIAEYLPRSVLGRAGGDEFTVFAIARRDEVEKTARAIITDMEAFDFGRIGCGKQVGCYIGGVTGRNIPAAQIRNFMDAAVEVIDHARKKGRNSIVTEIWET